MGTKKLGIRRRQLSRMFSQDIVDGVSISVAMSIELAGLKEQHRLELENLTLTKQPLETLKCFILAILEYLKHSLVYLLTRGVWLLILCTVALASGFYIIGVDGPHQEHAQEFLKYLKFTVWWVALGVASSIGLGSGLHTFVLYLGPHIAFFTMKAAQCGRIDLKSAPYDTIQLERGPSWLDKDCSAYGPPVFLPQPDSSVTVPLSSILPQVQLEAILWGLGTALGELPPYFISKAAHLSGSKLNAVEELDSSSNELGGVSGRLNQIKRWLFSHSQHMNFITILILASVPNPLFDLAGIMCGQFGIPFWKFFLATMVGKAFIKAHMQTIFIISVCNNQLLEWIEKEMIWVFGHIPGLEAVLPNIISKLHKVKEKYHKAPSPASSSLKPSSWQLSWSTIWTTLVWLMLLHFFAKIVTATAQGFLRKRQELEFNTLAAKRSASRRSNGEASHSSQFKHD